MTAGPRVGLLWRREWDPPSADPPKLRGVLAAFAELGVEAEPVIYSDDEVDRVREKLLALDAVLVWVNPIEKGLDRSRLNPLLSEAAAAGVFVSAHPDVIARMGTKEVLVETSSMSWGTDTRLYGSASEFRQEFPQRMHWFFCDSSSATFSANSPLLISSLPCAFLRERRRRRPGAGSCDRRGRRPRGRA